MLAEGVPVIAPVELTASGGAPALTAQAYGGVPPVAASALAYGTPPLAGGKLVVVTVGKLPVPPSRICALERLQTARSVLPSPSKSAATTQPAAPDPALKF